MFGLDKESTYVLLIGEGTYPNWPQMNIPNVHANLKQLASLLSNPDYCGIPAEKIKIVKDEDVEDTSSAIYEFFDGIQVTNATVILYYSGHGLQSTKAMDDLFLATKNIRENKFEPSAIKISELRKLFSDCIAARKILLLDCCYAGKITKGFLSDDSSDTVAKLNEFDGTYIMAASSEYERARFDPNDPDSPTKFTGKFIEVIKNGIDTDDEYCTLNSIYNQIRTSFLIQKDAPKPVQVEQNNIAHFPIFKNKKFLERAPADEREWKDVIKKDNAVAYYKFKEQFPSSQFVKEADKRIDEIEDEDAWQKAKIKNTIGGYNFYLENYHSSKHEQDAKLCLAKLTASDQINDEEKKFWMQVQAGNTIDLLKSYTAKYPKGRYTEDALLRINELNETEREERFWNEVNGKNDVSSFQEYLKIYLDGKYCNEAKISINALQQKQKQPGDINKIKKLTDGSSFTKKLKIGIISAVIFLILFAIGKQISKSSHSNNSHTLTDTTRLTDPSILFGDSDQNAIQTPQNSGNTSTDNYISYWNSGTAYYNKEDYQNALHEYNKAIDLNSTVTGLYFNRGLCYSKLGNNNLAIDDFTTAIKLDTNNGDAYNSRGNVYYAMNNTDAACADYKQSADLNNVYGKDNYANYCAQSSVSSISVDGLTAAVKYDVVNNFKTGMSIFPQFTIKNAQGKSGTVNAYFFYRDRKTPLKDDNKNFAATDGSVSTWQVISPSYSVSEYNIGNNNFSLFIPYDELDLDKGAGKKYLLSFYITVFINHKEIKSSDWVDFYVTY